ncbi:hypothetical protein FKM82_018312 [Ascaphus truei]
MRHATVSSPMITFPSNRPVSLLVFDAATSSPTLKAPKKAKVKAALNKFISNGPAHTDSAALFKLCNLSTVTGSLLSPRLRSPLPHPISIRLRRKSLVMSVCPPNFRKKAIPASVPPALARDMPARF